MRILFTNSTLNIETGTTVSGISNHAETLNVMKGRVWVTVEGSPDDYWLGKGDSLTIEAGRLVVIEADKMDSQIYLPQTQEVNNHEEVRRVFDFFTAFAANPWKAVPSEQLMEVSALLVEQSAHSAAAPQIGYTDGICQQRNLAAPACPA
jgi:hypothetical protein